MKTKCNSTQKKLCNNGKDCTICTSRSFESSKFRYMWNDELNKDKMGNKIDPRMVFLNTHDPCWLDCIDCDHSFEIQLNNLNRGQGCQYCAGKKLCTTMCNTCYPKSFKSCDKEKFLVDKTLNSYELSKGSQKKYEFKCDNILCNHKFWKPLDEVSKGAWCTFCTGSARAHCTDIDCGKHTKYNNDEFIECYTCMPCHDKSFMTHEKAGQWDYIKNKDVYPWDILCCVSGKYWFICIKCKHSVLIAIKNITNMGSFCIYCANLKLCTNDSCMICYDKSFESHPKRKYWSVNNPIDLIPRQIFKGSCTTFALFDCDICYHEFTIRIACICKKNPQWCSYCANKDLCTDLKCTICLNKSFESHPRAKYWRKDLNIDENGKEILPRSVFKNCNIRNFYFECEKGDVFEMLPNNIVSGNQWCPEHKNKTEGLLFIWLKDNFPNLKVDKEAKFNWCKSLTTNKEYPFDFVIESHKLIIELDGEQHFKTVKKFKKDIKETQERDVYKMIKANVNGYTVIRVIQMDVMANRISNKWKTQLTNAIIKYNKPSYIFLNTSSSVNYNLMEKTLNDKIKQINCIK